MVDNDDKLKKLESYKFEVLPLCKEKLTDEGYEYEWLIPIEVDKNG